MSKSSDLEMPYLAAIPYGVLVDKDLCDGARIYFGCLVGLARKEGYCWASDEQLADMKSVSIATIKRWNDILEKKGFIKRRTKSVTYRNSEKKLLWKKERKIYVNDGFKESSVELSKNVSESIKNEPFVEQLKNEPFIKTKYLKKKKENLQKEKTQVCEENPPLPPSSSAPPNGGGVCETGSPISELANARVFHPIEKKKCINHQDCDGVGDRSSEMSIESSETDCVKRSSKRRTNTPEKKDRSTETVKTRNRIPKIPKENIRFGDHVHLKPGEYEKLSKQFTKKLLDYMIESINDWILSKNKKPYSNYAATIRNWIKKEVFNRKTKLSPSKVKEMISIKGMGFWNDYEDLFTDI